MALVFYNKRGEAKEVYTGSTEQLDYIKSKVPAGWSVKTLRYPEALAILQKQQAADLKKEREIEAAREVKVDNGVGND